MANNDAFQSQAMFDAECPICAATNLFVADEYGLTCDACGYFERWWVR